MLPQKYKKPLKKHMQNATNKQLRQEIKKK